MKFDTYEYKIPVWAICPLVYGDMTGLSDEDEGNVKQFFKDVHKLANTRAWHISFPENIDESKYFSSSPEFGLACDVVDTEILIAQA